ncbi:MAG: hypothetical protein MJY93_10345 [Fibrobacter sp.]|nr:hypothetical protein [Fibrobacter sp.]
MKRTEAQNLMHALQGAAPAIQKVGWIAAFDFICDFVSVFSFSGFKAKAFRFCHFFCPQQRRSRTKSGMTVGNVILSEAKDLASF